MLVRKKLGESFSVTGNYYVDAISSASVDVVVSGASPYKENRQQESLSVDYLRGKSTWTAGYLTSKENDYKASTWSLGVSQDMFGDLTTVSFGYSRGSDVVRKTVDDGAGGKTLDPAFRREVARHDYRVGVTQVLTRDLLLSMNFETVSEEGYLQNPYRSMRYLPAPGSPTYGARAGDLPEHPHQQRRLRAAQVLPALARRAAGPVPLLRRHLGHQRAHGRAGIHASLAPALDLHRLVPLLTCRTAPISSATCSPPSTPRTSWRATRKPRRCRATRWASASPMNSRWAGPHGSKRGTANLHVDHMMIDYTKFRDLREYPPGAVEPGTEPLYALKANIVQFYLSFWF